MFKKDKLDFEINVLKSYIDQFTMGTHYGKHHAAFIKVFNEFAEKAGVNDKSVENVLSFLESITYETLRKRLRDQGGGYYNHNLYFSTL
ncbi:hypothetical protein [Butyrivibrio sp. VCB2001]|uniref:hypothetical protein n=1 Tax=Butyrivibrio sp. VCB2001 TaxID=1280667 RepID=UPI00041800E4|nr:hypothetical protein [Butyrivibrio sp. VCB2001]